MKLLQVMIKIVVNMMYYDGKFVYKFLMGYFVLSWDLCGIRLDRASSANSSSTELTFSFSCFGAVSATLSCYYSGCLVSVSRISSDHNLAGTAIIPSILAADWARCEMMMLSAV